MNAQGMWINEVEVISSNILSVMRKGKMISVNADWLTFRSAIKKHSTYTDEERDVLQDLQLSQFALAKLVVSPVLITLSSTEPDFIYHVNSHSLCIYSKLKVHLYIGPKRWLWHAREDVYKMAGSLFLPDL